MLDKAVSDSVCEGMVGADVFKAVSLIFGKGGVTGGVVSS